MTVQSCDPPSCRVNTFEAGQDGECPGCGRIGHRPDTHEPYEPPEEG